MASKKYVLMAAIICLFASGSYAQAGASYDVKDTSLIPSRRMPQHSEFLNGTYTFPAKPRNQIEIGLKAGAVGISGDVPAVFPTPGFGVHVRKAFGYVFSMRAEYIYGVAKGLSWLGANNYGKNPAWKSNYVAPLFAYNPGTNSVAAYNSKTGAAWTPSTKMETVFYNYKSNIQDLSVQGVVTLNNLRFHKRLSPFIVYLYAGVGATAYKTFVNTLDANGKPYDFSGIPSNNYSTRKETKDAVKAKLDDSYETLAETEGGSRRPKLGGNTLKPSANAGFGAAYKLSDKVNLALEYRHTLTNDDLMDGQRWQDATLGVPAMTRDVDSYSFLSLGINVNLGTNAVEPLWWLNPLDYTYSEIRNPRLMRLPKPVLPDSDLDGVTDQFDQEQTPGECPVDSHGVTKDTDGDGIPDCKDKELITPTYCQPVDADGIGKCPCPDGCKGVAPAPPTCSQLLGALPSVSFAKNSSKLTDDTKRLLAVVADRMRNAPGCKVVVIGYCASNKIEQQRSWDRVNNIITYLQEKEGVSGDRFIFKYGEEGGDCDVVDIRSANDGEEGTNTVPAPHPNLRKN